MWVAASTSTVKPPVCALKSPISRSNLEVENDELYIISAVHHGMGASPWRPRRMC